MFDIKIYWRCPHKDFVPSPSWLYFLDLEKNVVITYKIIVDVCQVMMHHVLWSWFLPCLSIMIREFWHHAYIIVVSTPETLSTLQPRVRYLHSWNFNTWLLRRQQVSVISLSRDSCIGTWCYDNCDMLGNLLPVGVWRSAFFYLPWNVSIHTYFFIRSIDI